MTPTPAYPAMPPQQARPSPPQNPPPQNPQGSGPYGAGPYPTPPGTYGPGPGGPGGGVGGHPGPYGPPPPRRNTGAIVGWVVGGVVVVALIALTATLSAVNSSGSGDAAVASGSSTSSKTVPEDGSSTTPSPTTGGGPTESGASEYIAVGQIRAAMLNYINARNARNIEQMRASVCTQSRERISAPPGPETGNIVIDGFRETIFDGNVAQAEVVAHLEKGDRRTAPELSKERFLKERGSWIYCPDAEPDIGA
ncbi:hypothetical protein [Gordonia aurantiaca]|uniref:hypothetical protein n=1 Tax=Gordonia sp. B21 TaxID=3151852 RepID=UPI003264850C